jgi:hypothetical protein
LRHYCYLGHVQVKTIILMYEDTYLWAGFYSSGY